MTDVFSCFKIKNINYLSFFILTSFISYYNSKSGLVFNSISNSVDSNSKELNSDNINPDPFKLPLILKNNSYPDYFSNSKLSKILSVIDSRFFSFLIVVLANQSFIYLFSNPDILVKYFGNPNPDGLTYIGNIDFKKLICAVLALTLYHRFYFVIPKLELISQYQAYRKLPTVYVSPNFPDVKVPRIIQTIISFVIYPVIFIIAMELIVSATGMDLYHTFIQNNSIIKYFSLYICSFSLGFPFIMLKNFLPISKDIYMYVLFLYSFGVLALYFSTFIIPAKIVGGNNMNTISDKPNDFEISYMTETEVIEPNIIDFFLSGFYISFMVLSMYYRYINFTSFIDGKTLWFNLDQILNFIFLFICGICLFYRLIIMILPYRNLCRESKIYTQKNNSFCFNRTPLVISYFIFSLNLLISLIYFTFSLNNYNIRTFIFLLYFNIILLIDLMQKIFYFDFLNLYIFYELILFFTFNTIPGTSSLLIEGLISYIKNNNPFTLDFGLDPKIIFYIFLYLKVLLLSPVISNIISFTFALLVPLFSISHLYEQYIIKYTRFMYDRTCYHKEYQIITPIYKI
jgi:hypothetical protein